jgi:glycosyltransferase involved in cell wall biosynthesis
MNSENSNHNSKISIGLPVYNGEYFLEQRLNSLLGQTFSEFELIISDNASTDSTSEICKKFVERDSRITYYRQEQNMGPNWNFNFVLQKSHSPYFLWAGVNDKVSKYFLEKNYKILEIKPNVIGSISKIEQENLNDIFYNKQIDHFFVKLIKKLRSMKTTGCYSIIGSYENKIRFFLKKSTAKIIYGMFRTNELKKSIVKESFIGNDSATMLNILKFGDFHIVEDDIMYEHIEGLSSTGIINMSNLYNLQKYGNLGKIFAWYPFTMWFLKNFKEKMFIKNFDFFIQLNFEGIASLFLDSFRLLGNKIFKK